MKQKYIYSRTKGIYSRIVDETESTYHITDDMADVYIEDKRNMKMTRFGWELCQKAVLVRHRFRNILVMVNNVDIDDYYHMYHVTGEDLNLW